MTGITWKVYITSCTLEFGPSFSYCMRLYIGRVLDRHLGAALWYTVMWIWRPNHGDQHQRVYDPPAVPIASLASLGLLPRVGPSTRSVFILAINCSKHDRWPSQPTCSGCIAESVRQEHHPYAYPHPMLTETSMNHFNEEMAPAIMQETQIRHQVSQQCPWLLLIMHF
jgi:hypothetical protein